MKEVFYVMGHGLVQTDTVLDHKQRFGIPIISLNTEGELTYPCPTMLLIPYYMKIHGNLFMNRLLTILLEYGEKYTTTFQPNETKLEQDIRFLFDVNHDEQKVYPQNVLRAYSGSAKVLNTSITCGVPAETFFYHATLFQTPKHFEITYQNMLSSPGSQYSFNEVTLPNHDQLFSLVNPFGIFKFDEQQRTFDMKYRMTEAIHPVSDILAEIHRHSSHTPIVFMIHCKEPDNLILKFKLTLHPAEKFHKQSLTQMMKALTIKPTKTPSPSRTKTKKRKISTKQTTAITIRKSKPSPHPTKRMKREPSPTKRVSPPKEPVPMDISPI